MQSWKVGIRVARQATRLLREAGLTDIVRLDGQRFPTPTVLDARRSRLEEAMQLRQARSATLVERPGPSMTAADGRLSAAIPIMALAQVATHLSRKNQATFQTPLEIFAIDWAKDELLTGLVVNEMQANGWLLAPLMSPEETSDLFMRDREGIFRLVDGAIKADPVRSNAIGGQKLLVLVEELRHDVVMTKGGEELFEDQCEQFLDQIQLDRYQRATQTLEAVWEAAMPAKLVEDLKWFYASELEEVGGVEEFAVSLAIDYEASARAVVKDFKQGLE